MRRRAALFSIAVILLAGSALRSQTILNAPGREIALSPDEVKDSFFAYVIGVIGSGAEVELSNSDLRGILTEFTSTLALPFDLISSVSRRREPGAALPYFEISFSGPASIPIPFSFLGYHPGSINTSQDIVFTETRPVSGLPGDTSDVDIVYVMRLSRGAVYVNVDDWLEWLIPSLVQDMEVESICIFRASAGWYGLLSGTGGNTGDPIVQFFDFTRNSIVYPISRQFRELGERIRNAGAYLY